LSDWNSIGFKSDGSAIIGTPNLYLEYTINDSTETNTILQFNKVRNELGVFLYSSDYSSNTQTNMNSLDYILSIEEGDIKLGETIKCKVEEIREEVQYDAIEDGKLMLSAEVYTNAYWQLKEIALGDEVSITMSDKTNTWNNVVQAIGGYKMLLDDGVVQSNLLKTNKYPTTAVGVKGNGEVVFFQNDGRQSDWSNGISYYDSANYLKSLGCVDAILLDGGGSSTMTAKLPYEESPQLVNIPSDGSTRSVGNSLLILAKNKQDNSFSNLFAHPHNVKILKNASFDFDVYATDSSFYPVSLPSNLSYKSSSNLGTIDSSNSYTAGSTAGSDNIIISSNEISTDIDVEILSTVTNIEVTPETVSISSSGFQHFDVQAYYEDDLVMSSNEQFTWKLSNDALGEIDEKGNFRASSGNDLSGYILVSYGDYTTKIPVEVGKNPVTLESFENAIAYPNSGATWSSSMVRASSVSIAIMDNSSNYVKVGNKSLKLSYDFTGDNSGIAGAYAHLINSSSPTSLPSSTSDMIEIEGYPSSIGMWVYGDNSKNWLRSQLRDSNNTTTALSLTSDYNGVDGGINWTGWKYITVDIPEGLTTPLYLDVPVRVMCTNDKYRTKGTIYVDEIKAIYTYDDSTVTELPSTASATSLVNNALTNKTFYDFNNALYAVTKIVDENAKAILLSKLATIESSVWTDDIKTIYTKLNDLVDTGSAKTYDNIQVLINSSDLSTVDKNYLLYELTTWGMDIVWTDDYKLAMNYYLLFSKNQTRSSAIKAVNYIQQIKNSYSKKYLIEEYNNIIN
jgi:hypothetical protein